jgi:hypothetical protein
MLELTSITIGISNMLSSKKIKLELAEKKHKKIRLNH